MIKARTRTVILFVIGIICFSGSLYLMALTGIVNAWDYFASGSIESISHSLFPWASFRKAKGGIKLHVAMNHKGNLPEFVTVTEARKH